jgi:hypothetical protein
MRRTNPLLSISEKLYQLLMTSYPPHFRQTYGQDLAHVFQDLCRKTYQMQGAAGVLKLWPHTLFDLLASALQENLVERSNTMQKMTILGTALAVPPILVWIFLFLTIFSTGLQSFLTNNVNLQAFESIFVINMLILQPLALWLAAVGVRKGQDKNINVGLLGVTLVLILMVFIAATVMG